MNYKNIISKSFKIPQKQISDNNKLIDYNWDSLTKINLITEIDKNFGVILDFQKFDKLRTFKDLDNLIKKTLKK